MKSSPINKLARLAGLTMSLALFTGSVGTVTAGEIPTAKGGATKQLELNRTLVTPKSGPSTYVSMSCPKCTDTTVVVQDNEPTKGAAAKSQLAKGIPTKLVSKHECEGCGNEWVVTGHGKAKVSVAVHKCTSCGSEVAACCNTRKNSEVATKGMEKDIKVAPLK